MKIAVVGAGFSGLAVSWHLLANGIKVDLYEQKGVGSGASGVSSGLLHPYAGEQVRRSWKADEALESTRQLLEIAQAFSKEPVADFSGVIRHATEKQSKTFLEHVIHYGDVEALSENLFIIKSAIVVHSESYLMGLFEACKSKGLNLILKKVESFDELQDYDDFVLAMGNGVFSFQGLEDVPLSRVKGQSLLCEWPFQKPLEKALVGKGHIVPLPGKKLVYLGSTYERDQVIMDEEPCLERALELLRPRAKELIPEWEDPAVVKCKAGIRVSRPGFAVPWIKKVGEKGFLLTAMGSRGLLYHSYFAKMLTEML